MNVEGGKQALSSTTVPLEHRTPILTSLNVFTHVVEQDLGGVKGAAVIVVIPIEPNVDKACLDID